MGFIVIVIVIAADKLTPFSPGGCLAIVEGFGESGEDSGGFRGGAVGSPGSRTGTWCHRQSCQ